MPIKILADKLNVLMCTISCDGYFNYLNPYWSNVLGWSTQEIMAIPFIEYVHPEDRKLTMKAYRQLVNGEEVSDFRNRFRTRVGEYVWFQWYAAPLPENGVVASVHEINDVVLLENDLKQHSVLFEKVSTLSNIGHWSVNFATKSVFWSKEIYLIHGVSPRDYSPELESAIDFYHPEDAPLVKEYVNDALAKGNSWNVTLRIMRPDGTIRTVRITADILRDSAGLPVSMFGVFQDVTDYEALNQQVHLLSHVANASNAGVVICDKEYKVIWINAAFTSLTGYVLDEVKGRSLGTLLQGPNTDQNTLVQIKNDFQKGKNISVEILNYHKSGHEFWNRLLISPVKDSDGNITHFTSIQNDVTDKKQAEKKLTHIAHYDVLTNLPNRVLLADRINYAMVQCKRRQTSIAVAFLDLDGFKSVNDMHGHNVGDELLVALSKPMRKALREGDTLARIGGDEFIAVIVDLPKIQDVEPLLRRLLNAAAKPVMVGDTLMQVSVSIGVTFYPQDNVDAAQLMRHADQAMYLAKQAGKNRYQLFDIALDNAVKNHQESMVDIRTALDRHEFVLHYQPKVNMRTGEVIGVEALIRWQHPDRGLLPPIKFLSAIDGHAISVELGEWVIDSALSQISQWQHINVNLPISINISGYQLQQRNFAERLAVLLAARSDVNPHYLELEILESSALSDINQVSTTMAACNELGVHFALDDFGTGYSSLTHLRRLPAHLIKIDQSFVRDMLEDEDDLAIIQGILGLAKAFQRQVIAEGVETATHGIALLKLGCELAQGYGIARPMPADYIPEWISRWEADNSWIERSLNEATKPNPT